MKIMPTLGSMMSGSLRGITASHNKGGLYLRGRVVPTNPATANQLQVRAAMTELVQSWSSVLTQTQRDAWDLYAQNVPVTDTLGESMNLSGINWFISSNTPVIQAQEKINASGPPTVNDGPTIFNRGSFTTPTAVYSEASGLTITITPADDWANEDDAQMLIYEGAPQSAGRNFFKGPFRLIGQILGDSVTPPLAANAFLASVLTAEGYTVTQGQKVWTKIIVARADGRTTSALVLGPALVGA